MMLMSSLQCYPVKGQFFGKPMLCFGFPELLISSASLHSATDLWLIVMVIPCVVKLDLPKRQKVALALVLSLGIFVIAASMVRLQLSLHRHYRPNSEGATNTLTFFVMTILECDLALICASAPTLRPFLGKVFPAFINATKRRSMDPGALRSDSFDLTSLTYEGYPWGNPGVPPPRSKDGSVVSHLNNPRMPPPVPPLPMSQKTKAPPPPPLNLKGAVLGSSPRLGGAPLTGDGRPMLGEVWEARRTSSIYSNEHHYANSSEYSPTHIEPPLPKSIYSHDHYSGSSEYSPTHVEPPLPKTMRLSLGPEIGNLGSFMTEARDLTASHSNRASTSFVPEGRDLNGGNYNRASTSFMNEGKDFADDRYNRASTSYMNEGKDFSDGSYYRASTSYTSEGKDYPDENYNRASTSFTSEGRDLTSHQNRASTSFVNEGNNNLTVGYHNRYSTSYITEPGGRQNRLSSMSGLSGATYTVGRFAGSARDDSRRLTMDIPQERDRRIPPPRPKRPDDPTL
ncbi:uncharacterized protein CTRU02_210842 [Colletotrichum truncatum]|uniref:Integral membrane protein n=1 Tax=Colletotrichum truncatum TaxID=5467 RepID=A0ACC3YQ39_COLTU